MPRKIHVASQTYLRNWTQAGRVLCTSVPEGRAEPRRIEQVGFRNRWWGSDARLAAEVEKRLSGVESDATPLLRNPTANWPIEGKRRAQLAQFIAMHIVRSPAWRQWYDDQLLVTTVEAMEREPERADLHFTAGMRLREDGHRVMAAMRQLPTLATILASMQWTLIEFDRRILAVSDQPVSPVRLADGSPVAAMPHTGFMATLEIRVPLSPTVALLLTWQDRADTPAPIRGSLAHACSLNLSTITQADRQWFRHPEGHTPRLMPPLMQPVANALSVELLDGYSMQASAGARRRRDAQVIVDQVIAKEITNRLTWVMVHEQAA
jgi:hypothetical protein